MTVDTAALLIGFNVALAVCGTMTAVRMERDRSFYPVVLIVTASYYVLFATLGSGQGLVAELGVAAVFVLAAVVGFRRSLWLVAAAFVAHGVFDVVHDRVITNDGVPTWWPSFCFAFDIAAPAYMAWRLASGNEASGSAALTIAQRRRAS